MQASESRPSEVLTVPSCIKSSCETRRVVLFKCTLSRSDVKRKKGKVSEASINPEERKFQTWVFVVRGSRMETAWFHVFGFTVQTLGLLTFYFYRAKK